MDRIGIQIVASRPDYLAVLLGSLRNQTVKDWDLNLVVQDPNFVTPLLDTIFKRLEFEGHRIRIQFTKEQGIGRLRNLALMMDDNPLGCRIDDDSFCEPDYLEILRDTLLKYDSGVVGGIVPEMNQAKVFQPPEFMETNVRITRHFDVPFMTGYFYNTDKVIEADHITSSYMYLNSVMKRVCFPTEFDQWAGFREETLPLLQLKKLGYKHYFNPQAICWHLHAPSGGTKVSWERVGIAGRWKAEEKFKDMCYGMQDLRETVKGRSI